MAAVGESSLRRLVAEQRRRSTSAPGAQPALPRAPAIAALAAEVERRVAVSVVG
jgi:hypothetical protein